MLTGENGILKQAQNAKLQTDEAKLEEQRQMTIAEANMNFENKIYTDKNGNSITIPSEFAVSQVEGENTIDDGLVIIDKVGNEFVWVPVPNIDEFVTIEGYYNGSLQSYLNGTSEPYTSEYEIIEYNKMKESVSKYKGFFIGRYETGKVDNKPVIKANVPVYNNIKWGNSMTDYAGGAVEISKNFSINNNYQSAISTLCYSVQWDACMNFFDNNYLTSSCSNDSYVINSEGKGNYSGTIKNTGSDKNYSYKNVYDMAGNVYEWTMEAAGESKRVRRGGNYNHKGSTNSCCHRNSNEPRLYYEYDGFRIALYLK